MKNVAQPPIDPEKIKAAPGAYSCITKFIKYPGTADDLRLSPCHQTGQKFGKVLGKGWHEQIQKRNGCIKVGPYVAGTTLQGPAD